MDEAEKVQTCVELALLSVSAIIAMRTVLISLKTSSQP